MIELTLSSLGVLCGYAGTIWCIVQLVWGLFRNDGTRCLIYGIGVFAAFVIALNVGGVLNEETWAWFGVAVFGLHALTALATGQAAWRILLYTVMCASSLASVFGLVRWTRFY